MVSFPISYEDEGNCPSGFTEQQALLSRGRETIGSFLYRKASRHGFFPSITCDYFPTDSQASMGRALDLTSRMLPLKLRLGAHQVAIICFRGLVMAREVMHAL